MSSEKNVAFRSALSGYNREDVNKYILEMNREFEEREHTLKEEAECVSAQLAEISAQSQQLKKQLLEAEAVIAALRESSDLLKEKNAALTEQLHAASAQADTSALCQQKAEAEIIRLQAELQKQTELSQASEKSLKYDQISAQIGDIMINANTSADQIVASANTEAARIMAETEEEAMYIRTRLSDTADEMLSAISERLHISTDHCLTEILSTLRDMRDASDALVRDFGKKAGDLSEKIEEYHTSVSDTVSRSLSDMDVKYGIRKKQ